MRHFVYTLCMAAALILTSPAAHAQDAKKALGIAVADVQLIVTNSKAGKSLQEQIAKQNESFKNEFSKLEKELMESQKKIAEQKDAKPEDLAAQKKQFETKLMDANKLVQERRKELAEASEKAVNDLRREIVKVVAKIAETDGYDLVVSSQNVIVSQENMDITDKVQKQLDKDFPNVKLAMAGSTPAAEPAKKK